MTRFRLASHKYLRVSCVSEFNQLVSKSPHKTIRRLDQWPCRECLEFLEENSEAAIEKLTHSLPDVRFHSQFPVAATV